MNAPTITYPETTLLSYLDSLTISVSGYTDIPAVSVEVNGSSLNTTYNPQDNTWSYTTSLSGYGNYDFIITSKDIFDNTSPETSISFEVNGPVVLDTIYNKIAPILHGKTNAISSIIEASDGVSGYSTSGVTYASGSNDFTYDQFIFQNPTQDILFKALDSYGNSSNETINTLKYQLNTPSITSLTLPVSSINVSLSGNSDLETESLVYSPTGGTFVSGHLGENCFWVYDLNLKSPVESFTIKSIDVFEQETSENSLDISYALNLPEISEPSSETVSSKEISLTGTCAENTLALILSNHEISDKVRISSQNSENYLILQNTNNLILTIDSVYKNITLPLGNTDAQSLVILINASFNKEVSEVINGKISLFGNQIIIGDGTANSILGFQSKTYNLSVKLSCPDTVSFTGRNILNLNVDDTDYSITFNKNQEYTRNEIISLINTSLNGYFASEGSLILSAEKNIFIKQKINEMGISSPLFEKVITYSTGNTSWSTDYTLISSSDDIYIYALDELYNYTSPVTKTLTYTTLKPLITLPGIQRTLTNNTCDISGSTTVFKSSTGNFLTDGVIVGDYLLVTKGNNLGVLLKITNVGQTFIETSALNNAWEIDDTILVYSNDSRPNFTTNALTYKGGGICDSESQDVFYYTESPETLQLPSLIEEVYTITDTTNTLNLNIDGENNLVYLTSGIDRSATDVCAEINSFFTKDICTVSENKLCLTGNQIILSEGTANESLGYTTGEYNLAKTITSVESFKFASGEDNTIKLNVDNKSIIYTFTSDETFSITDLCTKINATFGSRIAYLLTSTKIIILAKSNLHITKKHDTLGFSLYYSGACNYLSKQTTFNFDNTITNNSCSLYVATLNNFYDLQISDALAIVYKIDKPILTSPTLTNNLYTSEINIVDLKGDYDSEGSVVLLNEAEVFCQNGYWINTVSDLSSGSNSFILKTEDIFGGYSDEVSFTLVYTDPNSQLSADTSTSNTQWKAYSSFNFLPEEIEAMLSMADAMMQPIIDFLELLKTSLDAVKIFISKGSSQLLDFVKNVIQEILNNILGTVKEFLTGAGVYVLSTFPTPSVMKTHNKSLISYFDGGFTGFIDKVEQSFKDIDDKNRPQLGSYSNVGGYVIAVDSGAGIKNFMDSLSVLMKLFQKEPLNSTLNEPINLKAVGQNKRIVLTWERQGSFKAAKYIIKRSSVSGGTTQTEKVKTQIPNASTNNSDTFTDQDVIDSFTGSVKTEYETIGEISTSLDTTVYFKFIDGKKSTEDNNKQTTFTKVNEYFNTSASLTTNSQHQEYVDWFSGYRFLEAIDSTETDIENGIKYYYQVIPVLEGSTIEGSSHEVYAAAIYPTLVEITEDLSDNIYKNLTTSSTTTTSTIYDLKSSIYDKDTALLTDDVTKVKVIVDGAVITPKKIYSEGRIILNDVNAPKTGITVTYLGKEVLNATKAKIIGTKVPRDTGDFLIKDTTNTLKLQVGEASNVLKTMASDSDKVTTTQTIVFSRNPGRSGINLTPSEVVAMINSQTIGIEASLMDDNRIALTDHLNPDIYGKSYLKIIAGNDELGFVTGDTASAGPSAGTFPDWQSIKVPDLFPMLTDVITYVNNVFDSYYQSVQSTTNSLLAFIDLLEQKVNALEELANAFKKILESLVETLRISAGFYFLEIPSKTGGNDYFISALKEATGAPENTDYTGGIVLLYSSGSAKTILDFLFKTIKV